MWSKGVRPVSTGVTTIWSVLDVSSQASHATEMASIKSEIASRLPQLADKALAEARQYWHFEAERDISTAKQTMCQRLREMQVRPQRWHNKYFVGDKGRVTTQRGSGGIYSVSTLSRGLISKAE